MVELGNIENVDPRSVWPNEAGDFTPWLAEHADLLGKALGMDLEIEQREASVGAFSLDLLGKEAGSNRIVIVENQLERTDHVHLGQLLAYAAGLDARIVVWISPEVRDEHRDAIHWLNEQTTDAVAFFAIELEVWRIGESLPAPRFNVVAQPSTFQREIIREATTPSERDIAYQEFFRGLIKLLGEEHLGFTRADIDKVRYESWKGFGAGRDGLYFEAGFLRDRFRVGLTMNARGNDSRRKNKSAFDQLHAERGGIEQELGQELEWERSDEAVMSRIVMYREGGIESSQSVLNQHTRWAVDLLPRFRDTFEPRIAALDLDTLVAEAYEEAEAYAETEA